MRFSRVEVKDTIVTIACVATIASVAILLWMLGLPIALIVMGLVAACLLACIAFACADGGKREKNDVSRGGFGGRQRA